MCVCGTGWASKFSTTLQPVPSARVRLTLLVTICWPGGGASGQAAENESLVGLLQHVESGACCPHVHPPNFQPPRADAQRETERRVQSGHRIVVHVPAGLVDGEASAVGEPRRRVWDGYIG